MKKFKATVTTDDVFLVEADTVYNERSIKKIHFKSIADFHDRFCGLWMNQKQDETYEFSFQNSDIEKEWEELVKCFESPVE